jgi:hypothetical protein
LGIGQQYPKRKLAPTHEHQFALSGITIHDGLESLRRDIPGWPEVRQNWTMNGEHFRDLCSSERLA